MFGWLIFVPLALNVLLVVGGIGILLKTIWGYYLLMTILYLLFLMFPIGSIVSYKLLGYIERNNIKALMY